MGGSPYKESRLGGRLSKAPRRSGAEVCLVSYP
jgi:hypothetical protein